MRLPFSKPRPNPLRAALIPGISAAALLVVAAAATYGWKKARSGRDATSAPPTGTAGTTPDKPAGTELHPPNTNPARQGPGSAAAPSPKQAFQGQGAASGEPPPHVGPGQPGITSPKR